MTDSRYAALRHYVSHLWPFGKKLAWFIVSLVAAGAITYFFKSPEFEDSTTYTLFIFAFAVGLWVSEAIPPFAVGVLIIGLEVALLGNSYYEGAPMDVAQYVNTWSSPIIWLMLGGFFIAEGMHKSRLDESLFNFTIKTFGLQPNRLLLGLMLTTMVASMIMSNTATTAMMIASVLPMLHKWGSKAMMTKRLLLGIPIAAGVGGMGTIIGSPPNAIAVGALENQGIQIDFLTWMAYGVPMAIVLTILCAFVLVWRFPAKGNVEISFEPHPKTDNKILRRDRIIVTVTLAVTLLLWLTAPIHGFPTAVVAGIPIVCLTVSGVLTGMDIRRLPWDTLMLVAGGLSLGLAIEKTGLAIYIVEGLGLQNLPEWLIILSLAWLTALLSNIMSNTATATILLPIAFILLPDQLEFIGPIIGLCASTALLLPVSTPPNAIAYSTGLLEQKDFRFTGLLVGIAGPLLILLWMLIIS